MAKKLSEADKTVLRILFESKDDAEMPTAAIIGERAGMSEADALRTLNRLQVLGYVSKPQLADFALSAVDEALKQFDPKSKCDLPERVLMASLMIGSGDEDRISRMGLSPDDVRAVGDRLRQNGIWDAGGVDEPNDGVDFAMMCCIAHGHVERKFDRAAGEWKYSMTAAGVQHVEHKLGGKQ